MRSNIALAAPALIEASDYPTKEPLSHRPPASRPRRDGVAGRAMFDDVPIGALPVEPRRGDFDSQRPAAVQLGAVGRSLREHRKRPAEQRRAHQSATHHPRPHGPSP